MNTFDLIIIVLALIWAVRGFEIGFLRQVLSLAGFIGGLFLGAAVAPWIVKFFATAALHPLITLGVVLSSAVLLSGAGEMAALRFGERISHRKVADLDPWLGASMGILSVLFAAWLMAPMLGNLPLPSVKQAVNKSNLLTALNRWLPPAPPVLAHVERLLLPNGFPRVFIGPEPSVTPATGGPSDAQVAALASANAASVVKIEGVGCGAILDGSGWVVAPGLVITNAHVIAGLPGETVISASGRRYFAQAVMFDPQTDLAALRVPGLVAPALPVNWSDEAPNTPAAVLGYPNGGPYRGVGAVVVDQILATGRNIYDRGLVSRAVYELAADVEPGNSGGPLLTSDGRVAGVVFARSETQAGAGYALTMTQARSDITAAESSTAPVGTGPCTAD